MGPGHISAQNMEWLGLDNLALNPAHMLCISLQEDYKPVACRNCDGQGGGRNHPHFYMKVDIPFRKLV